MKKESKAVAGRVLRYIKRYRAKLVISLVFAFFSVLFTILFPLLTGRAIDAIFSGDFNLFFTMIGAMIISALLTALLQYLMNRVNNVMAYGISRDIRSDAFSHLHRLPLSYIDSHPHGDIVSRIITDADQVSDGLLLGFTQLFTGVVTILGTLISMFLVNWIVALVVLFVTPVSLFAASFIARKTFSLFYKQSEARGAQTAFIDEMISGSSVVAAYGMEESNQEEFDKINKHWAACSLLATFYSSLTNPVTRFVNSLVYTGVALSGGLTALTGAMSIGALTSILSYASQYTKPFNEISGVVTELQNALASAARIFAFLDAEEENEDDSCPEMYVREGRVEMNHIGFSYTPEREFIKDFSLSVEPGMKIAIVGPTGSGKTTLINLLMRFYDPQRGTISIDGVDISSVKRTSLRKCYGMVLQDTWLKNGSIRENIALGKEDASDEEIRKAARLAHLDSFIASLPDGYDALVSDDSDGISAGQKQLISISRIMLAEPEMLILDEATSSIDTRTEMMIQEAFMRLMKGRTSFIVAHRLSTIRSADLILVVKDGDVIESGTHQALMEKGGFYATMYKSQFSL